MMMEPFDVCTVQYTVVMDVDSCLVEIKERRIYVVCRHIVGIYVIVFFIENLQD